MLAKLWWTHHISSQPACLPKECALHSAAGSRPVPSSYRSLDLVNVDIWEIIRPADHSSWGRAATTRRGRNERESSWCAPGVFQVERSWCVLCSHAVPAAVWSGQAHVSQSSLALLKGSGVMSPHFTGITSRDRYQQGWFLHCLILL